MSEALLKILATLLITTVIIIILKPKSGEYAFLLTIGAGVIAMLYVANAIYSPIKELNIKLNEYGVETEYFKIALKALGISYITDFIAAACNDSGQSSLAAKAHLAGKAAIFILSAPIIISVLEMAVGFLK